MRFRRDVFWGDPQSELGIRDDSSGWRGELQGLWGFVKMCVVAVHDQTWVSMLSFSCDRSGLGFVFITKNTEWVLTSVNGRFTEVLCNYVMHV